MQRKNSKLNQNPLLCFAFSLFFFFLSSLRYFFFLPLFPFAPEHTKKQEIVHLGHKKNIINLLEILAKKLPLDFQRDGQRLNWRDGYCWVAAWRVRCAAENWCEGRRGWVELRKGEVEWKQSRDGELETEWVNGRK